MATCIVIFGAAVRADGSASGSLRRRCEHAAAVGRTLPSVCYLVTGGVGRFGPAEALVMREQLVGLGIAADRVTLEDQARDTLESVRRCAAILRGRRDVDAVLACSSSYHAPRCALLLRLAGFPARATAPSSDRPTLGTFKWLRYVLKECIATPWDVFLLMLDKIRAPRRRP
jgi:uncharacterized SAM-binding protein YcdF (DUF218 family)